MNSNSNLKRKSQKLAYLLRHDTDYEFDIHGWRDVEDLVFNHGYTLSVLDEIVATNNKQRYEFNEDKTKIRARQGHSISVDVELSEAIPPKTLYHGTSTTFLSCILAEGIKHGLRLHVHLSKDVDTAISVGQRHGNPVVLNVDAERMVADGVKFYKSNNGVWLTDFVDKKYIQVIE